MNRQRTSLHVLILTLLFLCAWIGLALQSNTVIPGLLHEGKTIGGAVIQLWSYFTITTNTIIAVTVTCALLFPNSHWGRNCAKPETITAIAVYIIVVGLVYNLILRPLSHFTGWDKMGNELVHSAVPTLYIIYWLVYATKGSIKWSSAYKWLLYPFLYLVYTFIRGMITDWYPYPFMDVKNIGYTGFWLNSFYLLMLFVTLNLALISLDKTLAKRRDKRVVIS